MITKSLFYIYFDYITVWIVIWWSSITSKLPNVDCHIWYQFDTTCYYELMHIAVIFPYREWRCTCGSKLQFNDLGHKQFQWQIASCLWIIDDNYILHISSNNHEKDRIVFLLLFFLEIDRENKDLICWDHEIISSWEQVRHFKIVFLWWERENKTIVTPMDSTTFHTS